MITQECYKFCLNNNIYDELVLCLNAVDRLFSNVIDVIAELDCFESACFDDGPVEHIVIRVTAELTQDYGMMQYDEYISWLIDTIPAAKTNRFVMCLHRV